MAKTKQKVKNLNVTLDYLVDICKYILENSQI